jgi:hypothetical protein
MHKAEGTMYKAEGRIQSAQCAIEPSTFYLLHSELRIVN